MNNLKDNLIQQIDKYCNNNTIDVQLSSFTNLNLQERYTIKKNKYLTITDDIKYLGSNVTIFISNKNFNFNDFFINTASKNIDTITWTINDKVDNIYLIVIY